MPEIIDLDVFTPEPATIKFQGQEILVNPPKVIDLVQLSYLIDKFVEGNDKTDAEIKVIIDKLTARLQMCIPELASKELSYAQIKILIAMLTDMVKPQSVRDLESQGVTRDTGEDEGKAN
jgi:hypothetical protein